LLQGAEPLKASLLIVDGGPDRDSLQPMVAAYYQRLYAAGKSSNVALIARPDSQTHGRSLQLCQASAAVCLGAYFLHPLQRLPINGLQWLMFFFSGGIAKRAVDKWCPTVPDEDEKKQ
jgi:hypothetical protein